MEENYKSYSLKVLKDVMADAVTSEATPEEIYIAILHGLKSQLEFNQSCVRSAKRVLELLGDTNDVDDMSWASEWTPSVPYEEVSRRVRHSELDAL
mgnify:FL=1